jgi:hypothetical protein
VILSSQITTAEARRAVEFDMDIYELESGRIRVVTRGRTEGMLEFDGSEEFAQFVARCQRFLENDRHAKKTMEWLVEQNNRFENGSSGGSASPVRTDEE